MRCTINLSLFISFFSFHPSPNQSVNMKLSYLAPFGVVATAFVIPDDRVMSQVAIEPKQPAQSLLDNLPSKDVLIREFENSFSHVFESSKNAFDEAVEFASSTAEKVSQCLEESSYDTDAWLATELETSNGHKGHNKKPNLTVYQLISESKYTTKLAGLINEYDDLVQLLNGTAANYTIFAPIDKAFEKIPDKAPKPSKELLKKVLTYHVSSDFYPAGRVLVSHTVPTLLTGELLGGNPQRLSTNIGLRGLTVNFYSRIIAINIVSLHLRQIRINAHICSLE